MRRSGWGGAGRALKSFIVSGFTFTKKGKFECAVEDPRKSWVMGTWGDFINLAGFITFCLDPRYGCHDLSSD